MGKISVRPLTFADHAWISQRIIESWGAEIVIAHETIYRPAELPGFVALAAGEMVGLLTYHIEEKACEIVTLDSWSKGHGVGTTLIEEVKHAARQRGCDRLWLITTNDNISALGFYQKRGFILCALRMNAITAARRRKPEIPLFGENGIPIRDELELEMWI